MDLPLPTIEPALPQTFSGYRGSDLLECFLVCLASFEPPSGKRGPLASQAALARESQPETSESFASAPLKGLEFSQALTSFASETRREAFDNETCHALWGTLRETLCHIEPLSIERGQRIIPRTLDEAWTLIESADISSEARGSGSSSSSRETKRL
jgi:hypothetical protein